MYNDRKQRKLFCREETVKHETICVLGNVKISEITQNIEALIEATSNGKYTTKVLLFTKYKIKLASEGLQLVIVRRRLNAFTEILSLQWERFRL